jgi:adenylate cyclase
VWRTDEPETFLPNVTAKPQRTRLTLEYRGMRRELQPGSEALTIGREDGCDLVVVNSQASRHHCMIQQRHGHFVVVDRSTNGTYVTVEGDSELLLRHAELTLRRRGWISFGAPRAETEAVEFFCD